VLTLCLERRGGEGVGIVNRGSVEVLWASPSGHVVTHLTGNHQQTQKTMGKGMILPGYNEPKLGPEHTHDHMVMVLPVRVTYLNDSRADEDSMPQ
jgi:hypothetical protein